MKRIISIFLIISVCLLVSGCVNGLPFLPTIGNPTDASSNASSSDDLPNSNSDSSEEEKDIVDFTSWNMRLVNPWNAIPDEFEPQLAKIDSKYAGFAGAQFDARAIDQLHAMCDAAAKDGVKLIIISAWRSNDFQIKNFNRKVDRVMAADPTLTREQAEQKAATVVARPGTSEHQVGLAIDFNSVEDSFKNTKAYKWLVNNCSDYGFILRYTAEKQNKTGIIPEPWHYRYVGVEAAKLIEDSGLCLEEFIEKYNTYQ